jgi:hypothetical protein
MRFDNDPDDLHGVCVLSACENAAATVADTTDMS